MTAEPDLGGLIGGTRADTGAALVSEDGHRQGSDMQTSADCPRKRREIRAPKRGRLFKFFLPFTSYLVTHVCVLLFWIYFFILNRTTIIGRQNVGEERNTLLLANHQSMIDSFLIGMGVYFPQSFWKPYLIPWNPAAEENFFKNPVLAWLSDNWKCIPVRRGQHDFHAIHRMSQELPNGVMTLFPEGTRSRDGSVGVGRPGVGLVALATKPQVIPVAIEGMNRALPIGCSIPRIFQRIYVSYGPPLDCSEFYEMPRTKETTQLLVDRAMETIRSMHADLQDLSGYHP